MSQFVKAPLRDPRSVRLTLAAWLAIAALIAGYVVLFHRAMERQTAYYCSVGMEGACVTD